MKLSEIKPVFVEFIPHEIEEGILYISDKYSIAIHLCACGCGGKTVMPLDKENWTLTIREGSFVSLHPSIGNWSNEAPNYHAHYFILENKIEWV